MAEFTIDQFLSANNIKALQRIYKDNQPSPKAAIKLWIEEHPILVKKLTDGGLDVDYFSYSVEYVFMQSQV